MKLVRVVGLGLSIILLGACEDEGGGGVGVDAAGTGDGAVVCEPPPPDEDGDTLSNAEEGAADTDTDGTADVRDDDSDGDGIPDAIEAGDDNLCTAARDTDEDGVPDYRSLDADGNGIGDADEATGDLDGDGWQNFQDRDDDGDNLFDREEMGDDFAHPIDFDADGTPDWLDSDSDNDGVPDLYEGMLDEDGDGVPAFHDDDADGDGLTDVVEAGPDPSDPLDSDDDGAPDFRDTDSDNDGLADFTEDANLNGAVDAGETDPRKDDTDGDGYPDGIEWAAGTDGTDPGSGLDPDDFYFVLPYYGPDVTDDLDFQTDIQIADVLFEVDTTGSMGGTIESLRTSLNDMVAQISLEVPNVALGAAWFKDFPVEPFGSPGDLPFKLEQRITTVVGDVQAALNRFVASGGGDGPEAGVESLYQAVTGEGIAWTPAPAGLVPKFIATQGYDPSRGHGLIGGAGFRAGALPIIAHATDIEFHDPATPDPWGDNYWDHGIAEAHTREQALNAALAMGARFIGITSDATAKLQLQEIARATGAVVPPIAWGAGEVNCHTGVSGTPVPPDSTGLCPLVFDMAFGGTGVDEQVVDGIKALVEYGAIDISAVPVGDQAQLPALNTALFISAVTPIPPAPPGASITADVFHDVRPGSPVQFRVHAHNRIVESRREAQIFKVTIRVMGDSVTKLDERDVYVIVPGGGTDP